MKPRPDKITGSGDSRKCIPDAGVCMFAHRCGFRFTIGCLLSCGNLYTFSVKLLITRIFFKNII